MKKLLRDILQLVGGRIAFLVVLLVPMGCLIGLFEILMGSSLYRFLVFFGLVPQANGGRPLSYLSFESVDPAVYLLGVAFILAIVRFLSVFLPSILYEGFLRRLRCALTEAILGTDTEHMSPSVNGVSNVMANLAPRAGNFLNLLAQILVQGLLLLTMLGGMITLSFRLSMLVTVIILVLGLPLLFLRKTLQGFSTSVYRRTTDFLIRILKDVRNLTYLLISGAHTTERQNLCRDASKIFNDHVQFSWRYFATVSVPPLLGVLVIVSVVWTNARHNLVGLSELVPFVYLLSRMAGGIAQITTTLGQLQYGHPFAREMLTWVPVLFPEKARTFVHGSVIPDQLTRLQANHLSIGRGKPLLRNINLRLGQGETLLITGPSGKGKTTLLLNLVGVLQATEGQVLWNDTPVESFDSMAFRRRLAYAGPEPFLMNDTIETNLRFGLDAPDVSDAALRQALYISCAEFVEDLSNGLQHSLAEGGDGISAGQKQRLALARALLREPDVLLLDEAMANIDETTEGQIMERIRELHPDLMVIIISHRSSAARYADRHLDLSSRSSATALRLDRTTQIRSK